MPHPDAIRPGLWKRFALLLAGVGAPVPVAAQVAPSHLYLAREPAHRSVTLGRTSQAAHAGAHLVYSAFSTWTTFKVGGDPVATLLMGGYETATGVGGLRATTAGQLRLQNQLVRNRELRDALPESTRRAWVFQVAEVDYELKLLARRMQTRELALLETAEPLTGGALERWEPVVDPDVTRLRLTLRAGGNEELRWEVPLAELVARQGELPEEMARAARRAIRLADAKTASEGAQASWYRRWRARHAELALATELVWPSGEVRSLGSLEQSAAVRRALREPKVPAVRELVPRRLPPPGAPAVTLPADRIRVIDPAREPCALGERALGWLGLGGVLARDSAP